MRLLLSVSLTLACCMLVAATEEGAEKLYVGDSLICNSKSCYPKVFEASHEWQQVKEEQQLPAGLEVRINMDTGFKEARLGSDGNENNWARGKNELIALETVEESTTSNETTKISPEAALETSSETLLETSSKTTSKTTAASTSEQTTPEDYEFTQDFQSIRKILNLSTISPNDSDKLESKLDDLLVFAHDYKHGYKIVSHEFDVLSAIGFNTTLNLSIRELSTRILASCMRNNPPVVEYISNKAPTFATEITNWLGLQADVSKDKILIKRYISILNELQPPTIDISILESVYKSLSDKQIKLKILDLASHYLSIETSDASFWCQELSTYIQDPDIDELQLHNYFHGLVHIKQSAPAGTLQWHGSFLQWLAQEVEDRKLRLNNGLEKRDPDQDLFDQQFIESRHQVFGNPLAQKIKQQQHLEDEL